MIDPKDNVLDPPDEVNECRLCGYECDADTDTCDDCIEEQRAELAADRYRDEMD